MVLTHSATGASNIPSHNLRLQTPARIWQRATVRPPVSIPAYRLGNCLPSRSQMIKSVCRHCHFCPAHREFNYCDSDLVLLQGGYTLWSWNGWVSQVASWPFFFKVRHVPTNSCSSINAPSSGNTADAFLAAAKAIGSSETPVGHSPSFLRSTC